MRRVVYAACLLVLVTTGLLLRAAPDSGPQPSYALLPLRFEENRGQAPAGVSYLAHTRSGVVLLRRGGMSLEMDGGRTISVRFAGRRGRAGRHDQLSHRR